jgi:glycosyltransferase involved in cell wall biosynthesis
MKIDMVSEHASPLAPPGGPDTGGQNVHVAALAVALARRGHEVVVFTRRDDADLPDTVFFAPGVSVDHVPAGPPRVIAKDRLLPYMSDFAALLSRRWLNRPPDVVHTHFWMSGLAALEAARGRALPVLQTFHALGSVKRRHQEEADTSPASRIRLEGQICREADAIIATCTDEVKELVEYGAPPGQVFVVPCGVDTTTFRPDGPVHGGPEGRHRIITFGRLVPRKGIDTIIEALPQIPDTELVVAGGPPRASLHDDAEACRLIRLAQEKGVANRVLFVGQVAHDDLPPLIRSADVAVSVPWYEPFGIAPVEAMACGVPVIVSAVGGHLDTVIDAVTGLHVPAHSPEVLAGRLRMLLADPELRRTLGGAAAERVRDHYTWSRVAGATEAVYHRMAANAELAIDTDGA